MPRPHYPAHGGPRRMTWQASAPPAAKNETKKEPPRNDRERQALESEIERLRRELARTQRGAGSNPAADSTRLLWTVLALCGGGLLFAIIALLRHG